MFSLYWSVNFYENQMVIYLVESIIGQVMGVYMFMIEILFNMKVILIIWRFFLGLVKFYIVGNFENVLMGEYFIFD